MIPQVLKIYILPRLSAMVDEGNNDTFFRRKTILRLTGIRAIARKASAQSGGVIACASIGTLSNVLVGACCLRNELVYLEFGMSVEFELCGVRIRVCSSISVTIYDRECVRRSRGFYCNVRTLRNTISRDHVAYNAH